MKILFFSSLLLALSNFNSQTYLKEKQNEQGAFFILSFRSIYFYLVTIVQFFGGNYRTPTLNHMEIKKEKEEYPSMFTN